MDKIVKIALVVVKKLYYEFPENQTFCEKRDFIPN